MVNPIVTTADFVLQIFKYLVFAGMFLTVVMIMWHGFNLLNSRGDPSAFSHAKEKIKNPLLGLGIMLISFLLLTTINPDILKLNFDFSKVQVNLVEFLNKEEKKDTIKTYTFQEIPVGTIMESLFSETSSIEYEEDSSLPENEPKKVLSFVPCYEYETKQKDGYGNVVIGDTIDQNTDGKIDHEDIIQGEDIFYCINMLGNAYISKVEIHLEMLIEELDVLMKRCTCGNCYTGRSVGDEFSSDHGVYYEICSAYCTPKATKPTTWSCLRHWSYCNQVCGGIDGCLTSQPNKANDPDVYNPTMGSPYIITKYVNDDPSQGVLSVEEFNQYRYDPCHNRLEIKCKQQEIDQLVTGSKPDEICYSENYIDRNAPKPPIALTINEAIGRLEYFKDFYGNRANDLEKAVGMMKIPFGERITLAEYNKLENESLDFKVEKTLFPIGNSGETYDISRYCRNFNSKDFIKKSEELEICMEVEGEKQYFYDGDGATFYYSEEYYKDKLKEKQKAQKLGEVKPCSIIEGDIEKGSYAGVIPIGETVTEALVWGKEVQSRINKIMDIVGLNGILGSEIQKLIGLSERCDCDRCKSGNNDYYYQYRIPYKADCECRECRTSYITFSCQPPIPKAVLSYAQQQYISTYPPKSKKEQRWGYRYSLYPGYYLKDVPPSPSHWVCPYEDFCKIVKNIYWIKENIEIAAFERVKNEETPKKMTNEEKAEQVLRAEKRKGTGYLQEFIGYFNVLMKLGDVKVSSIKDPFTPVVALKSICPTDLLDDFEKSSSEVQPIVKNTYCPYPYTGPTGAYFCPDSQVNKFWACPVREEDKDACFEDLSGGLEELIDEAKEFYLSVPVGNGLGLVDKEGHEIFWGAIEEAREIFDIYNTPQEDEEEMSEEEKEEKEEEKTKAEAEAKDMLYKALLAFEELAGIESSEDWQEKEEVVGGIGFFKKAIGWITDLFINKNDNTVNASNYLDASNIKFYSLALENQLPCDPDLSIKTKSRFDILYSLTISRKKLTGCVKGFSGPYKENPTEVAEVFSCLEGLYPEGLLVLPNFPYPKTKDYVNCFPYNNDDLLTEAERKSCFMNPFREGTVSNPGCLKITEKMMDNYYCCE